MITPMSASATCGLGDVAQSHLRGGVRRGDAGVLQADERDEQADARGDAVFQVLGDAVDQRLTELERGKNDEDNAFHQDGGEGDLPGIGLVRQLAQADGVGKIGVQAHAGSQRDGIVGQKGHHDGGHRRRKGSRHKDALAVHARVAQHAGVHGQDVRHRQGTW